MKIEIDQSGKIEKTNKHTYLAYSNSEHFVLKISSTEKKKIQNYFRSIGKPRIFIYATFASLLIILFKKIKHKSNQIIIEIEYPGKNQIIKDLIKDVNPNFPIGDIHFHLIGKKSRAHFLAYGTAINQLKPDIVVKSEEILKIIKKVGKCLSS